MQLPRIEITNDQRKHFDNKSYFNLMIRGWIYPIVTESFRFRRTTFKPKRCFVAPSAFYTMVCPEGCGICCKGYYTILGWFPWENPEKGARKDLLLINDKPYEIYVEAEDRVEKSSWFTPCQYLNQQTGRCGLHALAPVDQKLDVTGLDPSRKLTRPMGCDTTFIHWRNTRDACYLGNFTAERPTEQRGGKLKHQPYSELETVDGKGKEKRCYMDKNTNDAEKRIEQFERLARVAEYLDLPHRAYKIIEVLKKGPISEPVEVT